MMWRKLRHAALAFTIGTALTVGSSATAVGPEKLAPHSLVFAFDDIAVFGPLRRSVRLMPADMSPPGAVRGAVHASFDPSSPGRWILRIPFEERSLVPPRLPAKVRAVRLEDGDWVTVPARMATGSNAKHTVFIPLQKQGTYALVPGGVQPPSVTDLLARELRHFRHWVEGAGGEPVSPFTADELQVVGNALGGTFCRVRFLRSNLGGKSAGVLSGLLSFFGLEPGGDAVAMTFGERIYLPGSQLLVPGMENRLRDVLVHELWHVRQFRKLGKKYMTRYASLLLEHGYADHPMEVEANVKASAGRRALLMMDPELPGQNPSGQNPSGQNPSGQDPSGQDPSGQEMLDVPAAQGIPSPCP